MTEIDTARPVPVSQVWSGSEIIAENLEGDDLADVLNYHADASAWWVLPQELGSRLHDLARSLDLDALAVADLTADDRRPKFEQLTHTRLVITSAVSLDHDTCELSIQPVSMVISERAVICLTDSVTSGFNPAAKLAAASDKIAADGADGTFQTNRALQILVSTVISSHERAIEWLEDSADQLTDALFQERPLKKNEQLFAFKLRTALTRLRRITEPMRAVVDDLAESVDQPTPAMARQWNYLQEQQRRVADAADALGEALASVFETSLALVDLHANEIMKKLAGWAAIVAVPTLVTGFVGMNVSFPLDGTSIGFWVYLLIMIACVVALYLTFKRKDWI